MMWNDCDPITRRRFLAGASALTGALLLPSRSASSEQGKSHLSEAARRATQESQLIYVSPLRSDGSESTCHGEVWFVPDGEALLIVSSKDYWRTRAVSKGLDTARIWVGTFGVWKRIGDKYRSAPSFLARANLLAPDDPGVQRCLTDMARKYATSGWSRWGPAFHEQTQDGRRVVIRYTPIGA